MKKKLHLENWQGHKDSEIELATTMTTITGKSHHGKSSIIRAFGWMRDNKPKKPRFIRKNTKKAIVTLDRVRHERTASTNKYFIEGKEEPYTALRGAVPEEIEQELGIGPDSIQGQHDPIFLLNDSPGKVAQKLSSLVDLESTTRALKFIASKKRLYKAEVSSYRNSIEAAELQIEGLKTVEGADADLVLLECEMAHIETLREKGTELHNAIKNATQAKIELSKIPSIDALEPAKKLIAKYNELASTKVKREAIAYQLRIINKHEKVVSLDPSKLVKKAKRLTALTTKLETIARAIIDVETNEAYVISYKEKETKLQGVKDKLLEDTCPLCGRSD